MRTNFRRFKERAMLSLTPWLGGVWGNQSRPLSLSNARKVGRAVLSAPQPAWKVACFELITRLLQKCFSNARKVGRAVLSAPQPAWTRRKNAHKLPIEIETTIAAPSPWGEARGTAIELRSFSDDPSGSSPSPPLEERVGERRPFTLERLNSMAMEDRAKGNRDVQQPAPFSAPRPFRLGSWNLKFLWMLVVGIWNFVAPLPARAENALTLESFEDNIACATLVTNSGGRPIITPPGVTLSSHTK